MKSKVLFLLRVVLLLCTSRVASSQEKKICTDGGLQIPEGERKYVPVLEHGMSMCAVTSCVADPFPNSDTINTLCSEVSSNCSLLSTPHERNLSVCCKYCSECDFLTCPKHSVCQKSSMNSAVCQCVQGYEVGSSEQFSCVDVNECAIDSHDCPTHSDCINVPGAFTCSCHSGYSGTACSDVDECMETSGICPIDSECVNQIGSYECVCNKECHLGINSYYLTTPSEPDIVNNQGCSPAPDTFPGQNMVVCTGQKQLLTDHSTQASIPPTPNQYVGWDRNQGALDGFTMIIDANHTRLTRLDIHFYNNPSAGIGLPEVSSIRVSPSQANSTLVGPLSFVYARNEDLTQSDNGMKMVSIIITDDLDSNNFYRFVRVDFVYSSSTISRTQLTEIQSYGGTDSTPVQEEITFLSGSNRVVRLGVDRVVSKVDLSCTVANPGRFLWEWTRASDGAVLNSSVNLADLTRTSVLTIDKLSMEDSGEYVCRAFHSDMSLAIEETDTIVLDLAYEVIKDVPTEYGNRSDVTFSCEFMGYFPTEGYFVQWDFEGQTLNQDNSKYTVSHGTGRRGRSQSGRESTGPSVISSVTISSVEEKDKGIYGCRIIGDSCHQLIGYIHIGDAGSCSEPLSAESCSTEPVTGTISVWFFLFLVELCIIIVMVLVIIIFICILCCKHHHGNLYSDNKDKVSSLSTECKSDTQDNKYTENPLYDVINTPADYEVIHAPASYEVPHPPDGTDKKESE